MTVPARILSTEGGDVCPACGAQVESRIDLDDYRLFECPSCDAWSSDALARHARSSFIPDNYFGNADSDQTKWHVLWRRLAWQPGRSCAALDVGCGTGAYLADLRRRVAPGSRLEGIEIDPVRAEETRRNNPGIRIHQGDARDSLSRVEPPYDLVTLWDVFEHVSAPGALLQDLANTLSEDGVIYLQTIHEHSLLPTLGRLAYTLSRGRIRYPARRTHEAHHLVFFSRKALDEMAASAGLRIRELWFDRLARSRMDGNRWVTGLASVVLAVENALGNGLFVNLILERDLDLPTR